jgi:hypothetical protein
LRNLIPEASQSISLERDCFHPEAERIILENWGEVDHLEGYGVDLIDFTLRESHRQHRLR